MDNSARAEWKLDPKNQSGVFLGFAHRRNIYGAQILVAKAIITAKHQIPYDVELFPFQQRDNSNDRMQFLQSLLKRKTAPISDSALDNDHLIRTPHRHTRIALQLTILLTFTFLRRLIQMLTRSSPHHRLNGDRHAITVFSKYRCE
jgi:hypothetical protein